MSPAQQIMAFGKLLNDPKHRNQTTVCSNRELVLLSLYFDARQPISSSFTRDSV